MRAGGLAGVIGLYRGAVAAQEIAKAVEAGIGQLLAAIEGASELEG